MDIEEIYRAEADRYIGLRLDDKYDITKIANSILQEKSVNSFLNRVLLASMMLTNSDGGTLYLYHAKNLEIFAMFNRSLNIKIQKDPNAKNPRKIPVYNPKTGHPNLHFSSVHAVVQRKTINIPDIKMDEKHQISGSRSFDKMYGYHTKSVMTIPIVSDDEILGAMQLVNSTFRGESVPFSEQGQRDVEQLTGTALKVLHVISQQKKKNKVTSLLMAFFILLIIVVGISVFMFFK
jgi:transcriptional regulator with GAF, ATPase, and Fis domain